MQTREQVIEGLNDIHAVACGMGNDQCYLNSIGIKQLQTLINDATELLRAQEPRVMTFTEVKEHYNLPLVFVDDLDAQEDYYQDIQPLYFDFPNPTPWDVHWRNSDKVRTYLDKWEDRYNKTWRCWTGKPTDEQREAVKWESVK